MINVDFAAIDTDWLSSYKITFRKWQLFSNIFDDTNVIIIFFAAYNLFLVKFISIML